MRKIARTARARLDKSGPYQFLGGVFEGITAFLDGRVPVSGNGRYGNRVARLFLIPKPIAEPGLIKLRG